MSNVLILAYLSLSFSLIFGIDRISDKQDQVLAYIQKLLPNNPIVVEAGAFDGSDSVRMSKKWPAGKIHSFEPVPLNFARLKKNTSKLKNVKIYPLALAEKNGYSKFHVSQYTFDKNNPSGSGSLLAPKEHLKFDPLNLFNKIINVQTITLDTWSQLYQTPTIDFLWLDMQGYELPMLKNALKVLKTIKVIYCEVIFVEAYDKQPLYKDVKAWLENNNFKLIALDFDEAQAAKGKDIKVGEPYFGNAVFVNKTYFNEAN